MIIVIRNPEDNKSPSKRDLIMKGILITFKVKHLYKYGGISLKAFHFGTPLP